MIGESKDLLADFAFHCMREAGREVLLTTRGTSMLPLIRAGDRLSIRPVQASRIERGDMFAYWAHGGVVVHRCVGKKRCEGMDWLCEKGDHLAGWTWVSEGHVIGKVSRMERSGQVMDLSEPRWAFVAKVMAALSRLRIALAEKAEETVTMPGSHRIAHLMGVFNRMMARTEHALWALSAKCLFRFLDNRL